MKLKSRNLPDWAAWCIIVPIVVLGAPVFAAMGAGLGITWVKRRIIGPNNSWRSWFVWYPVTVGFDDLRWLEMVERRSMGIMCDTHHRALTAEVE